MRVAIIMIVIIGIWAWWVPNGIASSQDQIASLQQLAAPVAGASNLVVQCTPLTDYAGLAYPWETPPRIIINAEDCLSIQRIEWHQVYGPQGVGPLRVLLHEATHIRQGPFGPWNEHDAECGSLSALGPALSSLGYDNDWVNEAVRDQRKMIEQEQYPYGGICPTIPDRPIEHRTAKLRVAHHLLVS